MPPKTRTVGQVARLSQSELYSLAAELKVTWPKHALDLEIRAMVARALVGGDGVDLQCVTGAESRKKELEDPQAMMSDGENVWLHEGLGLGCPFAGKRPRSSSRAGPWSRRFCGIQCSRQGWAN